MKTETMVILALVAVAIYAFAQPQEVEAAIRDDTGYGSSNGGSPTMNLGELQAKIAQWATDCGQDPAIVLAFVQVESSFNPSAVNGNSIGLMQMIPHYWAGVIATTDPQALFDPETNIRAGCAILAYFQNRGFQFPFQADVYNLGETDYNNGKRNAVYRDRVQNAYNHWRSMGV